MRDLRRMIGRVAHSSAPAMLHGPSSIGKEMAARAIHASSERVNGPINSEAIPSELIESKLFGRESAEHHDWPGNVRELRNVFERGMALFPGETIDAKKAAQLLGRIHGVPALVQVLNATGRAEGNQIEAVSGDNSPTDLRRAVGKVEFERIHQALDKADEVIAEAARLLTLERMTLIEKMRRQGLQSS